MDYISDMNKLIKKLVKNLPEDDQIRIISMNMAPTLRLMLCMKSHSSLIELVADASIVETRLAQATVRVDTTMPSSNTDKGARPKSFQKVCYNCGSRDHLIAKCPQPRRKGEGQKVGAVRQNKPDVKEQGNPSGMQ